MNHSKEKNSAKKGFERKLVNGKNNPKLKNILLHGIIIIC